MISDLKECPECKASWDGGDIYQYFRNSSKYSDKTDEEIEDIVSSYGWTKENPKRFSKLIGIEVLGRYDGISYWKCPECETIWDRFTGKKSDIHE